MRRTERLFQIIQILRASRNPVTGQQLAAEMEVSLRTLYRDMAELVAQRVPIRGEAGTGYVLEDGYDLPPLMLTADEIEAAVLGAAWVARRGDPALSRGARDLVAKLAAVIPEQLRPVALESGLRPMSFRPVAAERCDTAILRGAIRDRRKLALDYADQSGRASQRIVWPLLIGYMEELRILLAWCELRSDFRHFRTDRIQSATVLPDRIPEPPARLIRRWQEADRARLAARADQAQ